MEQTAKLTLCFSNLFLKRKKVCYFEITLRYIRMKWTFFHSVRNEYKVPINPIRYFKGPFCVSFLWTLFSFFLSMQFKKIA